MSICKENYNMDTERLIQIEEKVFNSKCHSKIKRKHRLICLFKIFIMLLAMLLLGDVVINRNYYAEEFGNSIILAMIFLICVIIWNVVFLRKLYDLNNMRKTLHATVKTCNFLVIMETVQMIFDLIVFVVLLINMQWTEFYVCLMIFVTILGFVRDWSVLKMIKTLFVQIIRK